VLSGFPFRLPVINKFSGNSISAATPSTFGVYRTLILSFGATLPPLLFILLIKMFPFRP